MGLTAGELRALVGQRLGEAKLVVVSNREPYIHYYDGEQVRYTSPASGLVTALEPVMEACGGTWIAAGSGDADREVVDPLGRVPVPPDSPSYSLKRVWLTKAEEEDYYYGFANQAVWPLCHLSYTRPRFRLQQWETYREVNRKFAGAVLEEVGDRPAWVFIQDYHFALLPGMLKEQRPDLGIAHFWHIPWPNPDVFGICPWGQELLEGMLGNDLLGFQTQYHCNNFMSTVERALESVVDYEEFAVQRQGRRTLVRPFPISVDFDAIAHEAASAAVRAEGEKLHHELGLRDMLVGVGVDRMDYTKGIPERLQAIDRLLEQHPELHKRFVFLQVGPISRIHIDEYKALNDSVYHLMVEINRKYETDGWRPIRVLKASYPRHTLAALFRLADVCVVSSLHDGMNLVAKEFVSARTDGDGALVLSRFTGAARELTDAVLINPYDIDGFAGGLYQALTMPVEEKRRRMARMAQTVSGLNVYDWAASIVTELNRLGMASGGWRSRSSSPPARSRPDDGPFVR